MATLEAVLDGEIENTRSHREEPHWPRLRLVGREALAVGLPLALAASLVSGLLTWARAVDRAYEQKRLAAQPVLTPKEQAAEWALESMYPDKNKPPLRLPRLRGAVAIIAERGEDGVLRERSIHNIVAVRVPDGSVEVIGENRWAPHGIEVWDKSDHILVCEGETPAELDYVPLGHDNLWNGFADHTIGSMQNNGPAPAPELDEACIYGVNLKAMDLSPRA